MLLSFRLKAAQENKPAQPVKEADGSDQSDNDDDGNVSQGKETPVQEVSWQQFILRAPLSDYYCDPHLRVI